MAKQRSDNEMIANRRQKLEALRNAGNDPHTITKVDVTAHAADVHNHFEDWDGKSVRMAGRLMAKRGHGKMSFLDLQDSTGKIQLICRENIMGEDVFAVIRDLDLGDILSVEGQIMRSERGEISVSAEKVTLLTKSLALLPEKFHGLKDQDLRYRERYVDLIVNPEVKDVFVKRSKILSGISRYLDDHGYLAVETPILNTISGGANARPFITHHNTLDLDMYLRIANELYLKRLIVGGFDGVYEMGRMFRNEGMDAKHNPEYTAIELYKAYTDYEGMMQLCEEMLSTVAEEVCGSTTVEYQGQSLEFRPPWKRMTMTEAVREYADVDFDTIHSDEEAKELAKKHNIETKPTDGKGKILQYFFDAYAEEHLIQPTFIYEYPVEISPLAKRMPNKPDMTERFEAFICGSEIGNAFSELNDAEDQRGRFEHQVALREAGDEEAGMMDEDFLHALEVGLPPTGGMGLGIDRIVMFLTNQTSIRDVLLFPTMKPLGMEKTESAAESVTASSESAASPTPIDFSKVEIEPLFTDYVDFDTFSESDFRAVKVLSCEAVPKSKKLLRFELDDGTEEPRTILSGIHAYYEPEELVGKTCIAITNLPPRKMMGIDSCGMLISAIHEEEGEEKLHLLMVDEHIPAGAKLY
ncbi:lysine--tRNA ligase [Murdochiella massiliensis]|uniref:lysine--tRNA ligase n=1 Tax=Murdochiella massiliensis TaxID=1673723 RepID=UPI0008345252|nr:lysine--tRNA ligase [Murdochiella massiliensis]